MTDQKNITIILSIVTLVSEVGFPADYNFVADTFQEELIRVLHLMSQGTRSQVRQTEIEQQLSTLIAMVQTVQEQQAGQQELSRSLQSDLEGLAVSQQEQVVRLEDFAHRQEARLEELVQRQNARCSELEQRQMETQATVENLHQDIRAMKEVLNSRIKATESGLEGLEITQQRLTTELQSAKTAMMDEMVTELKAHFATKDQLIS